MNLWHTLFSVLQRRKENTYDVIIVFVYLSFKDERFSTGK